MDEKPTIHDAPLEADDMLDDYGHLEGWRRNQFQFKKAEGLVYLDPDVYGVFRSSEEVNAALRMLIAEGRVPSRGEREGGNGTIA